MLPFYSLLLLLMVLCCSGLIHPSCEGNTIDLPSNLKLRQNDDPSFYSTIYPVLRAEDNNFVKLSTPTLAMNVGLNSIVVMTWSRLPDKQEVLTCYNVSYEVGDIDECSMQTGSPWRHNCHPSTKCLNTEGSYECVCEGDSWGVKNSASPGLSSYDSSKGAAIGHCGGLFSTEDCCLALECASDKSDLCIKTCKSKFQCTNNPCEGEKCMAHSTCVSDGAKIFGGFKCECNQGYELNASNECIKIVKPVNEACSSKHSCPSNCQCNPVGEAEYECSAPVGYTAVYGLTAQLDSDSSHNFKRLDNIISCKSDKPPKIQLKGPKTLYYTQGDVYEEFGISLYDADGSVELDHDSFFVEFSESIFPYFKNVGTYQITYHVGQSRVVREIMVYDVNECLYTGPLDIFTAKCAETAVCKNTVGSYECTCAPGYEGDGRGCVDVVSPIVKCVGKGCNILHVKAANFVGLVDSYGIAHMDENSNLTEEFIEGHLEKMISTICQNGSGTPCFVATDYTMYGPIDLTNKIQKGKLERDFSEKYMWRVPFIVTDKAGNTSDVVYLIIKAELIDALAAVQGVTFDSVLYTTVSTCISVFIHFIGLVLLIICWKWISTPWQALKYLVRPFSLISNKEDFDRGFGFLLCITSFGFMPELQRKRKTAAKWFDLLDSFLEKEGEHLDAHRVLY